VIKKLLGDKLEPSRFWFVCVFTLKQVLPVILITTTPFFQIDIPQSAWGLNGIAQGSIGFAYVFYFLDVLSQN